MCGICGLYSPSSEPQPPLVDGMRERIRHRGPDQGSTDAFGRCVLGHQRLRVIDPTDGYQPVASESGAVTAVFNGEVYNFPELRQELAALGHEVRGRGDTPVLPHLYEELGTRFVERLDGMFAIALWDSDRRRLVLARDRLGKKPLVWTRLDDGTIAFASELKAFHALPGFRAEPDLPALDAFLALQYVPGTRTGIRGVQRLEPGSLLVVEGDSVTTERYWEPARDEEEATDEEWLERVRESVSGAVRKRLVADVPLGALLSGGLDSAIVVAQMAQAWPSRSEPSPWDSPTTATTSASSRGRWPTATRRVTRRSSSSPTPPRRCRASRRPSTSRSATRQRCHSSSSAKPHARR